MRFADVQTRHIVAGDLVKEALSAAAIDIKDAHMRDIEDAGIRSHRLMLFADGGVPERHIVTGEGRHLRAELEVQAVQRRLPQHIHAGNFVAEFGQRSRLAVFSRGSGERSGL